MMRTKKNSAPSTDKNDRRRGRPAGRNRTPLSLEERRARNAQYERERRNETADAMADLAVAAGCDPQIANAELLATVITKLQRSATRKLPHDIDDLKRINQNLESQIAALQSRLGQHFNIEDLESDSEEQTNTAESDIQTEVTHVQETKTHTKRRKPSGKSISHTGKGKAIKSHKIRKTSITSTVHRKIDSDTESQSDSSESDWSHAVQVQRQYQLRKRSQQVSEQSECSTSTYPYSTRSESSQGGKLRAQPTPTDSNDSNQSDASDQPENAPDENDLTLSALPDLEEFIEQFNAHPDDFLQTLMEGEKSMFNDWLEESEPVQVTQQPTDDRGLHFWEYDDFMLKGNA